MFVSLGINCRNRRRIVGHSIFNQQVFMMKELCAWVCYDAFYICMCRQDRETMGGKCVVQQ